MPQCKVIPLGPLGPLGGPVDSVTSSEPDLNVNLRYPYGADDTPMPLPLPLPQEWGSSLDPPPSLTGLAPSPSDVSFGTLPSQNRSNSNNPMLRRNQYWV